MINKSTTKGIILSLLLVAPAVRAVVLDFEDFGITNFQHGTVINTQYSNVAISATNLGGGPNLAAVFDSTLSNTRDSDLEGLFNSNNPSLADNFDPGNILIIQENNIGCDDGVCNRPDDEGSRPAGWISFAFAQAIELISIDFFDIEVAENGATSENAIRLFDSANSELFANTFYVPNTGGDNLWNQVLFVTAGQGITGIARIDVHFGGSGALDNLTYSVVPVPAAFWLFGTALIGFIGYSRRRSV